MGILLIEQETKDKNLQELQLMLKERESVLLFLKKENINKQMRAIIRSEINFIIKVIEKIN